MIIYTASTILSPLAVFFMALTVGFTPGEARKAVCVAQYESGLRPSAVNKGNKNKSVDHGLMQINDIWGDTLCKKYNLYDPAQNMQCAKDIYDQSTKGFWPWIAYRKNQDKCTETYHLTECRDPIVKGEVPADIIIKATHTCRVKYHACLKRIIKVKDQIYNAICGGTRVID